MNDMEDDESIQSAREESVPTKSLGNSGAGIGRTINHYKLLSTLGEGGMGIVYLAQQQHPIKRRVALKVIKPGMDTKQVLARFEAERQALAMLDHPNIAHVFEAGATEAGHPYFVMEYVEGVPITEHCDRHRLNIEDRLNLFRQACEAIQHAHQKGIIHRDIKPSNILVTIEQDKETLKIIDFGVAKATSQTLTERTLFTEQGLLIGTPEYMSPEQAEMTAQGIDTRSDIYSLGVVLYELLTGALPFDPAILRQAAFAEIQRIIREQDPPRPSTRLSSLGADATKVASSRRTEVASLTKRLHKELEWIPLKAMRKERDQRYKTASELGEDIKNYLDGSPLIAGPESAAYRVKKFIRKRRGPVVAAAVIVTTILVGLVASTTLYFQAEQARTQAVNARDKAQEAQKAEALQRAEAEKLKKEAVNRLVDHYEEQGRLYMESGKLDEALVFLNEAYQLDDQRYSLRFLLAETQRRLKSPIFLENEGPLAWEEIAKEGKLEHFTFNAAGDRVAAQRDYSAMLFGLWDAKTGKFIEEFDLSFGGFSADGTRFLALPSSFGEFRKSHHLQLCASSDGHLIAPLPGSFGYFAVDGKHVITVAGDCHFRIFDSTNGQLEIILKANLNIDLQQKGGSMERSEGLTRQIHVFGRLRRISFATSELAQMSSDGLRMVTIGDPNGSATVWEIKNGKRLYSIQPKTGAFTYATFSPNGQRLLTTRFAMKDEPVPLFVSTNLESESQLNIGKEDLRDPAATKESDRRSLKFDEGIAEVWSLDEGKRLTKLDDTAFFHYYERTIYSHFSPDGTTAITGERSQLKVWDLQKPVLLWQTKASLGTYSPDGKRIITGESNGLITVRDTRTGEKVGAIVGHQHTLESVRFCSDGSDCRIVTEDASRKCIISSWPQLQSQRPIENVFAHTPRGDRVLLTGTTAKVRVIPTGTNVAGFSRFTGTGSAFSVSPDRGFIALVDEKEGRITVFDTDVGEQKANWEFSGEDFTQVVFTLNGQHIITKSRVNHTGGMYLLRILNVKTGQVVTSIERDNPRKKFPDDWPDSYRNDDVYNSIVVSPDGETLAIPRLVEHQEEPDSTDVTSEVQLWDVKSGQLQITLTDFNTPIISMAFSHDSTQLVTVTTSAIVQLWETRMGRLVKTIGKNVSAEYAMFSPNAKKMILVGNEMQLWDTEVWRQIGRFPRAAWARFSPDFRRIVSSTERKSPLGGYSTISSNPTTWLWDAADGRLVATLLGRTVLNWHFTLDSKGLITEHQGGQIRLWNIEDGSLIYVLPPEENLSVTDISTDGQLFIARSGGRTKIWDLQKGRLLASHDENMGMKDLACGALFGSYIDRIFTFSSHPHDGSPRFNADSSRLITNRGLRNVNSETRSPEVVRRWIEAHVPLRLADGRFRPATPEEMYLAELNFHLHTLGQEHPETLGSELRYKGYLVGQCVRTGKMEEASDLIDIMQSWLSQKDTHLIREAKDVFKQLAKMYFERGLTGRRNEKYTEAIAAYEEAVRLNPKYALAFNNLAWLQATCPEAEFRNGTKAVEFATKACELTDWKEWNYLDTLAAAYAEAGNFSAAAKWQQKAIDFQTDGNQTETQTGMETRLKLYQSGQPYRQ